MNCIVISCIAYQSMACLEVIFMSPEVVLELLKNQLHVAMNSYI